MRRGKRKNLTKRINKEKRRREEERKRGREEEKKRTGYLSGFITNAPCFIEYKVD